jgi:hypothetical protein
VLAVLGDDLNDGVLWFGFGHWRMRAGGGDHRERDGGYLWGDKAWKRGKQLAEREPANVEGERRRRIVHALGPEHGRCRRPSNSAHVARS